MSDQRCQPEGARIMMCVHSLRRGGAERVVVEVARGLIDRGHEVLVVTWVDTHEYRDAEYQSIPTKSLTSQSHYAWLRSIPAHSKVLRKICGDFCPDMIQVHSPNMMWLLAYSQLKVDTYHILHGYGELDRPTSFRLIMRRFGLKIAHAVSKVRPVVVAKSMITPASSLFFVRSDPIVIANGIDIDVFDGSIREHTLHSDSTTFTVLMVGTLTPNKGQHLAIKAFEELRSIIPKAQLLIVGEGPTKSDLLAMIDDLDLRSSVHLLGMREDVAALMAKADVLWQLSRSEAAPMVVAEAMATGTPVVGFNVRGINDLVIQDETGFLVEYGDLPGLVKSTYSLYIDADLWIMASQRSRDVAIKKYSNVEMVTSYEELLRL